MPSSIILSQGRLLEMDSGDILEKEVTLVALKRAHKGLLVDSRWWIVNRTFLLPKNKKGGGDTSWPKY